MSFILEALKKSEKKRQGNNSPSSPTIHDAEIAVAVKSKQWVTYAVLLVVIGGAMFLWFYNSKPQQTLETIAPIATNSTTTAKLKNHDQTPIVVTPKVIAKPTIATEPKTQPQVTTVTKVALPPLRNENKIFRLSQLPISTQNRIPTLKMSLHAYARDNSSASMVQFNNRIMHEGDNVANNIKLEQITADGAVLSYDGYRFIVPRRKN